MVFMIPVGLVEWMMTTPCTPCELHAKIMALISDVGGAQHATGVGTVSRMVPQGMPGTNGKYMMQHISSNAGYSQQIQ